MNTTDEEGTKKALYDANARRRFTRGNGGERGDAAVVIAVIAVVILALVPLATYAASANLLPLSRGNQDYQAALAAAESGVSNYINYLNQNSSSSGNPQALTGWVQVPGASTEYFHYSVASAANGGVTITSTGIALHGQQTQVRTVRVGIAHASFQSYMINYNSAVYPPNLTQANVNCYPYSTATSSSCPPYSDYLYNMAPGRTTGKAFTNDVFYLNNGAFSNGTVSNLYSPLTNTDCPSGLVTQSGSCKTGVTPNTAPAEIWPTSPTTLPGPAASSGCYFYGPTSIQIGNPALGQMTVYSPDTYNLLKQNATLPESTPGCYGSTAAAAPTTWTISYPSNGVIYVDNLPSTLDAAISCATGSVAAGGTPVYIPINTSNSYACSEGDAVVWGTNQGSLTIGAANNIIVYGTLNYASCATSGLSSLNSTDITGLVANNNILINNATWQSTSPNKCGEDVMAAMLAVNGTLWWQSYTTTSSTAWGCTTTPSFSPSLYGNIASYYAGLNGFVTGGSHGNSCTHDEHVTFTYDSRFSTIALQPPFFPFPGGSGYSTATFAEITNPAGLPSYASLL